MIENQLTAKELTDEMLEEVSGGREELLPIKRTREQCAYEKRETYIRKSNHAADVRLGMKVLRQVYNNRCEECGRSYYGPDKKGKYYSYEGHVLK